MTNIKTNQEIDLMRKAGKILARVFAKIKEINYLGMTKIELDSIIEKLIIKNGGKPSFKNFKDYPFCSCLSLNNEIVHGLPNNDIIKNGDILGIDIGVEYSGYHADAAITVPVGKITSEKKKLIDITEKSLDNAIKKIKPGITLGEIQKEIERTVEQLDYCLVRSYTGHGIGKSLQEEPIIPNYYGFNSKLVIRKNTVFCIEPMVIIGKNHQVKVKNDGWTAVSASCNSAAHFEHTICVTKNGSEILTKI